MDESKVLFLRQYEITPIYYISEILMIVRQVHPCNTKHVDSTRNIFLNDVKMVLTQPGLENYKKGFAHGMSGTLQIGIHGI
jgi:hypothetical protein